MISVLQRETDSWLQAAINDWKHPVSRDYEPLVNTYDLLQAANSKKKPKPYPRPWPTDGKKRIGRTKASRDKVLKQLERMNPKEDNGN